MNLFDMFIEISEEGRTKPETFDLKLIHNKAYFLTKILV